MALLEYATLTVPDVVINDPSLCEDFSMAAGEFVEVYGGEINSWDCVTTCFFLDTAHSPFEYVRIIYDILKPGGYWVNLGPLLYHYEESPNERSVELAFDEVTICIHFYRSLQCIVSISIRDLLPFSLWVLLRSSGHGANCWHGVRGKEEWSGAQKKSWGRRDLSPCRWTAQLQLHHPLTAHLIFLQLYSPLLSPSRLTFTLLSTPPLSSHPPSRLISPQFFGADDWNSQSARPLL